MCWVTVNPDRGSDYAGIYQAEGHGSGVCRAVAPRLERCDLRHRPDPGAALGVLDKNGDGLVCWRQRDIPTAPQAHWYPYDTYTIGDNLVRGNH